MSIIESIFYGLISGLAEFLPVSSQAHQAVMQQIFGTNGREPVRDLFVHLAVLLSLFVACRNLFLRLHREQKIASNSRRSRIYDLKGLYDLRLVKTASLPLIAGLLLYIAAANLEAHLIYVSLFLILNGIILIFPEHMRHGNKEARSMTGLDSILIGLAGALSALPGVSRIGSISSASILCGADRHHVINWAFLLSVPALIMFIVFDVFGLITIGVGTISLGIVMGYFLSAVAAFAGGYLSILFVRFLTARSGFTGFAYYSWGAALFSFILYLIT